MIWHEVVTTEKVPFRYRVAGMGSRFLAWLIDFVLWVLLFLVGAPVAGVLETGRPGLGTAVMILWGFALQVGYFSLFEWLWRGQTPGKWLVGVRVIDRRGTAVTFAQAAIRNLVRAVDSLPIPLFTGAGAVGFAVASSNRERLRLGDLAAGTLVVHVDVGAKPIRALQDVRGEADRQRLALLRQRLGQLDREQKQTLLDLCLRRDQLGVTERARLFQAAARFAQQRLELAPDAYESDEKFILQLAAALGEQADGRGR